MDTTEDLKLLVEIAYKYYEEDWKQSEIAVEFNISRSLVSKYLTKAKEIGIIEFVIHDEFIHPYYQLEQKIISKYGLKNVICVESNDNEDFQRRRVAGAAGKYLSRHLKDHYNVAVAGGRTIHTVADSINKITEHDNITFVSMVGGLGHDNITIKSNYICDKFATKTNGKSVHLNAPVLVDSSEAKEVFFEQTYLKQTLNLARTADIAMVGIGGAPEHSSLSRTFNKYLEKQDDFDPENIVGDICYNFIDKFGNLIDCEWNNRAISIGIDYLKRIPNVIGVAEGIHKAESIHAVLQAQLIDTLVTDEKTAHALINAIY